MLRYFSKSSQLIAVQAKKGRVFNSNRCFSKFYFHCGGQFRTSSSFRKPQYVPLSTNNQPCLMDNVKLKIEVEKHLQHVLWCIGSGAATSNKGVPRNRRLKRVLNLLSRCEALDIKVEAKLVTEVLTALRYHDVCKYSLQLISYLLRSQHAAHCDYVSLANRAISDGNLPIASEVSRLAYENDYSLDYTTRKQIVHAYFMRALVADEIANSMNRCEVEFPIDKAKIEEQSTRDIRQGILQLARFCNSKDFTPDETVFFTPIVVLLLKNCFYLAKEIISMMRGDRFLTGIECRNKAQSDLQKLILSTRSCLKVSPYFYNEVHSLMHKMLLCTGNFSDNLVSDIRLQETAEIKLLDARVDDLFHPDWQGWGPYFFLFEVKSEGEYMVNGPLTYQDGSVLSCLLRGNSELVDMPLKLAHDILYNNYVNASLYFDLQLVDENDEVDWLDYDNQNPIPDQSGKIIAELQGLENRGMEDLLTYLQQALQEDLENAFSEVY